MDRMTRAPSKRSAQNEQLMQSVHQLARAARLTCMATEWLGARDRYLFRCEKGHEATRRLDRLRMKPFCLVCAKLESEQLGPMATLLSNAASVSVTCLETSWLGAKHRYRFRCSAGHEWTSVPSGTWRSRGCKVCARASCTPTSQGQEYLSTLQNIASSRGGVCLSSQYLGVNEKYSFRCAKGHEWSTYPSSVMSGSWCRRCHFDGRLLGIDLAHETAKTRGGECLSLTYVNSLSKLLWRCHRGHEWQAPFSAIRVGKWCKRCASMDQISNAQSKARRRYDDAGARLLDSAECGSGLKKFR